MATSSGWATLGDSIAGGNKLTSSLAYDQGEALGARTQDALAQARARIDQNNANANLDASLKPLIPDDATRAAIVQGHRAGLPPEQIFNSLKTNQDTKYQAQVADPTTSDDQTARNLMAMGKPAGIIQQEGEGQITNRLHPSAGVQLTPIGTMVAGQKAAETANANSEAALHTQQATHPEKFRVLPPTASTGADGSQPIENETTAQLVAAGQMAPPSAGTKAYMMLGGDGFMKRVNYLAGPQGAAAPPGAAPAGAAPAVSGAAPPTAPAPFQANFNGNTYGVNRTTANDFARSTGTGGKLDSVNRIAGHLGVLENLYQNMDNTNFQPTNQLINTFRQLTGKQYPGSAALAGQMIGTEIVKSMTNVGAGGQEERQSLANAFGPNGTPEGQKTAISTAQQLVAEQAKDLAQRGARGGLKDIYTPGKYFTPEAIKRYGLTDPNAAPAAPAAAAAAAAPASAGPSLPPQALKALQEGAVTTFGNGQKWSLKNGQPVQVQ